MFASNEKISIRQVKRMLILDLFGAGSLLLPGMLAKTAGVDGIFCIAAAALLAVIYLWFLGKVMNRMQGDYYSYLKRVAGSVAGDVIMIFYLFYFLLLAAFLLHQTGGLVQAWLLPKGSYGWICFLILLPAAFATAGGIEGRARIYEIIFWFLGIPLLLMLLLALREVNTDYWTPIVNTDPDNFFQGTVKVFAFFLPLCFLLFLKPHCAKPEKLKQCAKGAVVTVVALLMAVYLILLGIFQEKTTAVLERPVITLMSMVKLPGDFIARMDAFMTAIWFFSLFALMNTGVFYSGHILKEMFPEKKTHYGLLAVLAVVFFAARWFHEYPGAGRVYAGYIKYIALPVLVILPVIFCSGCGTRELEDRGFPLAMGVDKSREGMVLSFELPDLAVTSGEKNPSGETMNFSVEAGAYYEAQKAYENNTNKVLDYNHLKAIIISRDFLEDREALKEFLSWLEKEAVVARNTCLFAAEGKSAEILALKEETEGSVGKYLEQMLKTQEDFKENKIVTIGDLMNQWHNRNEALLIPVLTDNGGMPSVTEYAVVDAFSYKGNISAEDAMRSFLCRGMLKSFLYQLEEGEVVELQDLRTEISFAGGPDEVVVTVKLSGKGKVKKEGEEKGKSAGQIQKRLNRQLSRSLVQTAEKLLSEPGFDMTGSFLKLGGYDQILYQRYGTDYDGYQEGLSVDLSVDMELVN